jgi:hypothetical protein
MKSDGCHRALYDGHAAGGGAILKRIVSIGIGLALLAGCRSGSSLPPTPPSTTLGRGASIIGVDAGSLVGVDAGTVAATAASPAARACLAERVSLMADAPGGRGDALQLSAATSVAGVTIAWKASAGTLSSTTGPDVAWTPPRVAGIHTVDATFTDTRTGERVTLTWTVQDDGQAATSMAPAPSGCP